MLCFYNGHACPLASLMCPHSIIYSTSCRARLVYQKHIGDKRELETVWPDRFQLPLSLMPVSESSNFTLKYSIQNMISEVTYLYTVCKEVCPTMLMISPHTTPCPFYIFKTPNGVSVPALHFRYYLQHFIVGTRAR